jgi:hypothetical protein
MEKESPALRNYGTTVMMLGVLIVDSSGYGKCSKSSILSGYGSGYG